MSTLPPASGSGGRRNTLVYASGVVQGIVLVTFPAANSIFTGHDGYGLSSTQYGLMFVPQVVGAIIGALGSGALTTRIGSKRVYQFGIAASFISMALLVLSQFSESNSAVAYPLLLIATAFLGLGFGLTVSTLNSFAAAFNPKAVDRAVLVLNALLGTGTALAPVFVALFVGIGFWWGLPALSAVVLVILSLLSAPLDLTASPPAKTSSAPTARVSSKQPAVPGRFWLYAGVALLYGVIETMSGNWAGTFVTSTVGGSVLDASIGLTLFWAAVTVGRIVFAAAQKAIGSRWPYRIIPIVAALAYVLLSMAQHGSIVLALIGFAVVGLGCSALLPLTISFGEEELTSIGPAVSGRVIASYQVGYGIAAFGVGPLLAAGLQLGSLFVAAAVVSLGVAVCALFVTRQRRSRPAQ